MNNLIIVVIVYLILGVFWLKFDKYFKLYFQTQTVDWPLFSIIGVYIVTLLLWLFVAVETSYRFLIKEEFMISAPSKEISLGRIKEGENPSDGGILGH